MMLSMKNVAPTLPSSTTPTSAPREITWGTYVANGNNLAFGGADGKTVLIVGRGTMVRDLQMNVPGLP